MWAVVIYLINWACVCVTVCVVKRRRVGSDICTLSIKWITICSSSNDHNVLNILIGLCLSTLWSFTLILLNNNLVRYHVTSTCITINSV